MIGLSVAKLNFFSPKLKRNFSLNKAKKPLFCGMFGSIPTFGSTQKGKKWFYDEHLSVSPSGITQHRIIIKFFSISLGSSCFFSLAIRILEFKEFKKTIIPFALAGYG